MKVANVYITVKAKRFIW